jgi:hypothetical protein
VEGRGTASLRCPYTWLLVSGWGECTGERKHWWSKAPHVGVWEEWAGLWKEGQDKVSPRLGKAQSRSKISPVRSDGSVDLTKCLSESSKLTSQDLGRRLRKRPCHRCHDGRQ